MCVVRCMTTDTFSRLSNALGHRRAMACRALEALVGAEQIEVRIYAVIEPPNRPAIGVVALITSRPQRLAMNVVGDVARLTR
jgi:hypothetical protein